MKKALRYILLLLPAAILYCSGRLAAQPSKIWATYIGDGFNSYISIPKNGTSINALLYVKGYLYMAGTTTDTANIATAGTFKPVKNPGDYAHSYIAKFDTLGRRIWGTYWGGNAPYSDELNLFLNITFQPHMAMDQDGNIYIAGFTSCKQGMSTPGSFQPVFSGPDVYADGYLAKFNNSGQLLWCTYLPDRVFDVACDNLGNIYVTGGTHHSGYGTTGSFQPDLTIGLCDTFATNDAFLVKFSPTGQRLWGTYCGGVDNDNGYSIGITPGNDVLLAGTTTSNTGIATPGTYQDTLGAHGCATGNKNFIVKFNSGGQRIWGTYYGDYAAGFGSLPLKILCNPNAGGGFFVGGYTTEANGITTPGSFQPAYGGGIGDAFLSRFTDNGQLTWGTYYGGANTEFIQSSFMGDQFTAVLSYPRISLDFNEEGEILMAGASASTGLNTSCSYMPPNQSLGFMAKFTQQGQRIWGSYNDAYAGVSVLAAGPGKSFYSGVGTLYAGLATPGTFKTTKLSSEVAGLLAGYKDEWICAERTIIITEQNQQLSVDNSFATYQWYKNDAPISGADSNTLVLSDSGNYYVIVTDGCGCSYTSNTIKTGSEPTSIAELNGIKMSLFPNPNSGRFMIKGNVTGGKVENILVDITDITGRSVWNTVISITGNSFENTFDLSGMNNGMYLLRLSNGRSSGVFKIIKK